MGGLLILKSIMPPGTKYDIKHESHCQEFGKVFKWLDREVVLTFAIQT
jgi:hypothetical protein